MILIGMIDSSQYSIHEALFINWRLYLRFPGDYGRSTNEDAHREETDALEACPSRRQ